MKTKKRKKVIKYHSADIEYRVDIVFSGYDRELETKLEEAVGEECCGAGFGFGQRDMSWVFSCKDEALTAAKKLNRYKGVEVQITEYPKEEVSKNQVIYNSTTDTIIVKIPKRK